MGDPSSADRDNADEVARFLSTGIPSVISPISYNCSGVQSDTVTCITFVGFGQQQYAGYPGQRCAPLDAVTSAAAHRTPFCSAAQRDAFSVFATIYEGGAAVRLMLSVLSVLTLLVPALAMVVLAYASRTTIFRFELVLFPASHVSSVLVALVFFVVYALVLIQGDSLLCCEKQCSPIGSLTYMDGSRRSLADMSRSICTSALSKYRWDTAAVGLMLSVQALLYLVSIARSQTDHYEHLTWIKALVGRAPSMPGSLRSEAAAAGGAEKEEEEEEEEEEQHEEQGHGQEQEQNKSRPEAEDEMAMALLRGRGSSVGAAHLIAIKARPVCCCRDCLAIFLFLAGSLTIAFAALTVELIGNYVDLFTGTLGLTFAIRSMQAWQLLVAIIATIFAFGVVRVSSALAHLPAAG